MEPEQELRAARLRMARGFAGIDDATTAAKRFGWGVSTYLSHENGSRGIRPGVAKIYAKAYKISVSWLLTGEGPMTGPGIDAALMEIPPDLAQPLIRQVMQMINAAKKRTPPSKS